MLFTNRWKHVVRCAMAAGVISWAATSVTAAEPGTRLAFHSDSAGAWQFDTGVVQGHAAADGLGFGLQRVRYDSKNSLLSRSVGLVNVYRVFSDGKRYGEAGWKWPTQAAVDPSGALTITSKAQPGRPFALSVRYQWKEPRTLDVQVTVKPNQTLHGFETFLASYFDKSFNQAAAYVKRQQGAKEEPGFLRADTRLGDWLVFPRDQAAMRIVNDGRWRLLPHPVDWIEMPELQQPLAYRRQSDGGITGVLMAPKKDCFAIAMPYETEPHHSVYLSLFGYDIPAGKIAKARARLLFLEAPSKQQILDAYRAFQAALGAE